MSIKIYDGCIIRNTSILEFTKLINQIRVKSADILKQMLIKRWVNKIEDMVNDYQLLTLKNFHKKYFHTEKQKNYFSKSIFRYAEDYIREEMRKDENSTYRIDSYFDFVFSVVFFPYKEDILCFPIYRQKEFKEIWNSFKEIEEYGYWDNTDQPENISYEDFKKRGLIWEEVMNYNSKSTWIPALNGFTAEIITSYSAECTLYTIRVEDILKNITSTEQERINDYAESLTNSIIYKKILKSRKLASKNENTNDKDNDLIDNFWEISKQVKDIYKSEEGQILLKKNEIKISQKIKPITKDLIIKDVRSITDINNKQM